MKSMIRPAMTLFLLLTVVTGGLYPLAVTLVARTVFPDQATGSLVRGNVQAIGSTLIGQHFTDARYFWGRPSATAGQPYNGAASGGSNLGPLNPALSHVVAERIAALREVDPMNRQAIPVDLVTASASGLDPHISVAAARFQAERVARLRGLSVGRVTSLIDANTEGRQLGFLGEPRVNVLNLNHALDVLK